MVKINELPESSSRLLTSSQIISSIFSVVKELVENALDSDAKNVEVKLENFGLDKIEVKDNGCGIDKKDIQFVAKPHFTSKIVSFSDLDCISTYGFRGEALSAVCAVADFTLTTKSLESNIGSLNNFGKDGELQFSKPCPCSQGTTVSVLNLFKNIPVRRQFYCSDKNKSDELTKIKELLIAYGIIKNDVRFALYHNKNIIWLKSALPSTKDALVQALGSDIFLHMKCIEYCEKSAQRKIEIYLPKVDAPMSCGFSSSSKSIVVVNKRPVRLKAVDKILKDFYNECIKNSGRARYPICYVSFTLPSTEVDVNIEPNKTCVMLHDIENILSHFTGVLKDFYKCEEVGQIPVQPLCPDPQDSTLSGKPVASTEEMLDSFKKKCDSKIQSSLSLAENIINATENTSCQSSANQTLNCALQSDRLINNAHPVLNSTVQSHDTMNKKNMFRIGEVKEPPKKKQKTSSQRTCSQKTSKDFDLHLNTLKDFFGSSDSDKDHSSSPSSLNGVLSVTAHRSISSQNLQVTQDSFDNNMKQHKITSFSVLEDFNVDDTALSSVNHEKIDFNVNKLTTVTNINQNEVTSKFTSNEDIESKQNKSSPLCEEGNIFMPNPKSNSFVLNLLDITSKSCKDNSDSSVKDIESCSADKRSVLGISSLALKKSDNSSIIAGDDIADDILWSRGELISNEIVQPVVVLQPHSVTASKLKRIAVTNPSKKTSPKQTSVCFERKLTAFEIFCRNNRLEVAAENPEFSNQQIAQLLSEKWNNLASEEKAIYKNMMDKHYPKEVKKKERLSKTMTENLSQIKSKKKFKVKFKTKSLPCILQHIKTISASKRIISTFQDLNIINYTAPGIWFCEKNNKLYSLNTFRVQETVLYHRLQETFQFETEPLEVPVKISPSQLGDESMTVLGQFMCNSLGNICNEHLTANGFNIRRVRGENEQIHFEFVGIASCVSLYGVLDLKELLLLIKEKGHSAKLSECRPSKVRHYLQVEAYRMSRKSPACRCKEAVEDLLAQKDIVAPLSDVCIHNKTFFQEIWHINKSGTSDA